MTFAMILVGLLALIICSIGLFAFLEWRVEKFSILVEIVLLEQMNRDIYRYLKKEKISVWEVDKNISLDQSYDNFINAKFYDIDFGGMIVFDKVNSKKQMQQMFT